MPQNKQAAARFDSLRPELRSLRHQAREICLAYNRSPSKGHLKKLKSLFKGCGDEVFIEPGFHCDYGIHIEIGARSYLNVNCTLIDGGMIRIGEDCLIGPNVQLLTINHDIDPKLRLKKANLAADVILGNNVWLGAGCIILPGISVGEGSVIGAGSVVSRNIPAGEVHAGNPARFMKLA